MSDLARIQQEFMALLLHENEQMSANVAPQGSLSNSQRLDIYRSGYYLRLRSVLDSDHEALGLYLGDDLFEKMVAGYIKKHPSTFSSLRFFADALPDYLAKHEPFNQHPILSEIARFERTLLNAFDSADADCINEQALALIPQDSWPLLSFEFHPSLRVFSANWNSVESWQKLKSADSPDGPMKYDTAVTWGVWRGLDKRTQYISIDTFEHILLDAIYQGMPFAEVCGTLTSDDGEQEVAVRVFTYLQQWLQRGWITKTVF